MLKIGSSSLDMTVHIPFFRWMINMHGYSDSVMHCHPHPALNLKVEKMDYCLSNTAPDVPKVGQTFLKLLFILGSSYGWLVSNTVDVFVQRQIAKTNLNNKLKLVQSMHIST